MTALEIIILIFSYAFSGLLIYLIEHGLDKRYQFVSFGIALIIFLSYALFSDQEKFSNLNYGFLTLPMIVILVFNFVGFISWRINRREFRATWRGARYFYTEKKNFIDYLLSSVVIITELGWPIFVAVILKGNT